VRLLLTSAAIAATVAGCALPGVNHAMTPDASASLAISNRIAVIGQGQDWYGVIHQLNGRPDARKDGPASEFAPVTVWLNQEVEPGSSTVARACDAIANGVNDPKYGPSLEVSEVTLINGAGSHWCRPPADMLPPSP
jgi:hypothetical protein